MTKLLERAIAEAKKLTPERQDDVALTLLSLIEAETAPGLTAEQATEVRKSISARDFLSDDEAQALYRKYGL